MKHLERSLKNILVCALFIFALVLTGSPLGSIYYSQLTILFFIISLLCFAFNTTINKNNLYYVFILCALAFFSALIRFDTDYSHYLGLFLTHFAVLFSLLLIDEILFKKLYITTITIISLYSIIITLYINIFDLSYLFSLQDVSVKGIGSWKTIGFLYNVWGANAWTTSVRNSGFFREPGVMGMHICLAGILLLDKLNTDTKLSKKEFTAFILLVVAGVLTMSTVGVLGVLLLILLYFIKQDRIKPKHLIMIIAGIIFGIIVLSKNYDILFRKFNANNYEYVSMTDRLDGIYSALNIALNYPIFGAGYSIYHATASSVVTFYFVDLWGKYGIMYPIVVTFAVTCFIKHESVKHLDFIIIAVIMTLFSVSQGFLDNPIYLFLELFAIKNYKINQRR